MHYYEILASDIEVVGRVYQNTVADQQQSFKILEVDSWFNLYYNIYLK
ncbi:MAG: hypothetical protein AAGJ08_25625 [Cyanobacteria bacterium P01_H01_bin.35]